MTGRSSYHIKGMDCAEEITALRKTVGRLPGVESLDFDLLRGTMTVSTKPGGPGEDAVRAAVRAAGLDLVYADGGGGVRENFWSVRGRLIMCAASGVLLAAGFVAHAVDAGSMLEALAAEHRRSGSSFPIASIVLYAASVLAGAWFVAPKAWFSLRGRRADMNLLMTVAAAGAVAIGQWFEAAAVTFLFALALLLESWSVGRARRAIEALMDLAPQMASVRHNGTFESVPVNDVEVGQEIAVRPGERVPLDGFVVEGSTTVNQAPITGESIPVEKAVGDEVFAGTINEHGAIVVRVAQPASRTMLARIIRMVEEARARRAPAEQWVERFARFYTPAMIALAVVVAVVPPLFIGEWGRWFYQGLVMLVIACPCALVISTPVAIVAGLTSAARAGVLIKGGMYLEAPARLRVVAFDKTGTLTHGRPEVQQIVPLNGHTSAELLATAAGLEAMSQHPLAQAIRNRVAADGIRPRSSTAFTSMPGKGAEGVIDGKRYWIGSHRLMHERGAETGEIHRRAEELEDAGHSVVAVGNDRHVCGLIAVADGLRPGAGEAIRDLKSSGVQRVVMLTGDNEGTARAVAEATGVDECRAELLPADKIAAIEELVKAHGQVAMVGDGVNDAPAMSAATIGIAMGAAGTDVAIETADIALMSDDLSKLPWLVRHSRRCLGVIRQNIAFALITKIAFMVLAVAGLSTLWMAIAADMGASLLVIFNALRLLNAGR